MLREFHHRQQPYRHFTAAAALPESTCCDLESLFGLSGGWHRRDGTFYACSLRDVTREVDPALCAALVGRMRQITGLLLVQRVEVTAQRMAPGDCIGAHSDRPLLGYEMARLVVQLNRDWQPGDGGVLNLYRSPLEAAEVRVDPRYNTAFGFVLHPDSHHGVETVTRERRSVVFNFWHAANTPELAEAVGLLFAEVHFSELPPAVGAIAARAEEALPEMTTLRAGFAALALLRWGLSEATLLAGYRFSAGIADESPTDVVRLADWVARLHLDPFDVDEWRRLAGHFASPEGLPRELHRLARLCLPEAAKAR